MGWANTAKIRVFNLPGFVGLLHYRAKTKHKHMLIAYVRHQHTNYDNLLVLLEDMQSGGQRPVIYETLRDRVDQAVVEALDRQYGDTWHRSQHASNKAQTRSIAT